MYQIIQNWNPSEDQPSNILTIGKPIVQQTQQPIEKPVNNVIKPIPQKQNLTQKKSNQKFWVIPLLLICIFIFFIIPKNNVNKIDSPIKEPLIEKSANNITATPQVLKPSLNTEKKKQDSPKKIVKQEKKDLKSNKENTKTSNDSIREYNNNASEDLISIKGL